jgi:hypothetical protein
MPNRWPINSGSWSDSAIWSGSLIPTASDDVFTNNRIVYIDTDVTVRSIRNVATGSAIASTAQGNCFYLNNGVTLTATADGVIGSALNILLFPTLIISSSNSAKIICNVTITSGNYGCAIIMDNDSSLSITGSIDGGPTGNPGTSARSINHRSTGVLNVLGTVSGGMNTSSGGAIYLSGNGSLNVVGDIVGPGGQFSAGGQAITNASAGTVTITGSVSGSNIRAEATIFNISVGTLNITGSVRAGNVAAPAITSTTAGTIIVRGSISSSITANGISSTSTTATNLFTGPFYNTGSYNAVYAYRMQMLSTSSQWRFDTETAGVSKTLYTSNTLPGVPQQTDVRKGTTYNFGLTGSIEMPDPTTVKQGVAVDNTTGSAILTPQDMFDVATQTLTDSGSIGNLLTGASTVQTVGATISSFKV